MKKLLLTIIMLLSSTLGSAYGAKPTAKKSSEGKSVQQAELKVKQAAKEREQRKAAARDLDEYKDLDDENDEDALDIATMQEDGTGDVEKAVIKDDQEEAGIKDDETVDLDTKRTEAQELVERAGQHMLKHDVTQAFNAFSHTREFKKGEMYLFVYNDKGVCLAHGLQKELIWKNLYELRDKFGSPIVQAIIQKAEHGGGWLTYEWNNATKISYVQQVKKDDKTYIIGTGYYPFSKSDAVVNLVKGAVALFNDAKAKGISKDEVFSSLSYPIGRFVAGDLYLYAMDFKGVMMAQGDRPGLIGSNRLEHPDAEGRYTNKEIISKLKESPDEGIWITYLSKNARKRAYAERVEDAEGNNYFIACGYYPSESRDSAIDLVKKGYTYMKANGKSITAKDFTDKNNEEFRYGDLSLTVYDFKGSCIANGDNEEVVGQNHWDLQDEDGRFYVREMIQKAQQGGGWLTFKLKNSFESIYVEPIDLGLESKFLISCGIFPVTKFETMNLLVKSGISYLEGHTLEKTCDEFGEKSKGFIRGDLQLFILDQTGLCYVFGDNDDWVWQNLLGWKDDNGKPFIKIFINSVKKGSTKVTYKLNGTRVALIDSVKKDGKTYIIGSGFYKD